MTTHSLLTPSPRMIRVWDLGVRLFHWSLVVMVAAAYLTEDARKIHRYLGYAVLMLVGFRLIWGLIGPKHARFADFVPGPRGLVSYLRDIMAHREKRYLGHNPAGGAMVIGLLITLIAVGATGYMIGMDAWFGAKWVEELHEVLVNGLLALIVLHIGGILFSSLRHGENLVAAMITGKKRVDDKTPHD